ncbi:HAD family phosphatase [Roseibium sp. RKSG952]|uniref:HAD family hydrolase n=1 Tax=Roseibium sp. RKSG952 TaxID=2529384 RepID=UPI0012BB4CC1|nr:HAD family phosphatase [Roseibium sp. RKSG952]MTH95612.1 HAD family phosphatase [Roseibium sp. RKSG952]
MIECSHQHDDVRHVLDCQLVIFDCDGVLVDTEKIASKCLSEIITDLGYPITSVDCQKRFSGSSIKSVRLSVEKLIERRLPDDWPDVVLRRFTEVFASGVSAIDGVFSVLDYLEANKIPYCVASSGHYKRLRLVLKSSGLLDRFEGNIYSAQDCLRGKPFPDVFLYAASRLRTPPGNCIVIEDSVPGVKAALAADMPCFAYVGDTASDRVSLEREGAMPFTSMYGLPQLLSDIFH